MLVSITPKRSRQRSRRLRKKLHIDEFKEFGFAVEFRLRDDLSMDADNAFWDAFIEEAIEAKQLQFGGHEFGFVCLEARGSATETHRAEVLAWLQSRPEVLRVTVGPLVDAWYCP